MADTFTCSNCKREYELDKLRKSTIYINRHDGREYQSFTCVCCVADQDNITFDHRLDNKRWDDLSDAHPRIFNKFDGFDALGREIHKPAHMAGGVGYGWFDIISEACEKIEAELNKMPEPRMLHFSDMKEKFGSLRWSESCPNDVIMDIIDATEQKSYGICEECGKPGTQNNDGWISTLCPEHREERKNRQ